MGLLNWPFNSSDVLDEFSDATNHLLSEMYNSVFNAGQSGGPWDTTSNAPDNSLSDFDGTGLCHSLGHNGNDPDTFGATIFAEIDPQGAETYVYAELSESGGFGSDPTPLPENSSDADSFTTSAFLVTGTGIQAVNVEVSGLDPNTTYTYRLLAYNGYNDNATQFYLENGNYSFTTDENKLATPSLNNTRSYNGLEMYVSFNYSDNEDDFEFEVRINGNQTSASVDCQNNFGTSTDFKECVLSLGDPGLSGDDVEVRCRALETSTGTASSDWTSWVNVPYDSNTPSCPI